MYDARIFPSGEVSGLPLRKGGEGKPRILVVEDHEIGLEVTCLMLQRLGVEAYKAQDGDDAIAKIQAAEAANALYSLILMDFSMPILDGIAATQQLRNLGFSAQKLPIIAITANADPRDIQQFLEAGGQSCLIKPIKSDELRDIIETWLPNRHTNRNCDKPNLNANLIHRYQARKKAALHAINSFIAATDADEEAMHAVRDMLHKLAGTAGAFGDVELSLAAAQCEAAIQGGSPEEARKILICYEKLFANAL
jgi:CheY-like chemotaxis protein